MCVIFWVFLRRLIIVECRRFGTLYLFHLQRLDITLHIHPLKMEQIECSETSAFNNNQTPGKYPKDYTRYSKHGESLKSRIPNSVCCLSLNFDDIQTNVWVTSVFTFLVLWNPRQGLANFPVVSPPKLSALRDTLGTD